MDSPVFLTLLVIFDVLVVTGAVLTVRRRWKER